jgi:ribosomal protein S27AE
MSASEAGKGDKYRKVNRKKYNDTMDKLSKKCPNCGNALTKINSKLMCEKCLYVE